MTGWLALHILGVTGAQPLGKSKSQLLRRGTVLSQEHLPESRLAVSGGPASVPTEQQEQAGTVTL